MINFCFSFRISLFPSHRLRRSKQITYLCSYCSCSRCCSACFDSSFPRSVESSFFASSTRAACSTCLDEVICSAFCLAYYVCLTVSPTSPARLSSPAKPAASHAIQSASYRRASRYVPDETRASRHATRALGTSTAELRFPSISLI